MIGFLPIHRDHEMFASMQLMKPFSTKAPPSRSSVSRKEVLDMMEKAKNRVRHLLEGTYMQELLVRW
jgi:hypothetical protein